MEVVGEGGNPFLWVNLERRLWEEVNFFPS